jgi:hypothetical protein
MVSRQGGLAASCTLANVKSLDGAHRPVTIFYGELYWQSGLVLEAFVSCTLADVNALKRSAASHLQAGD